MYVAMRDGLFVSRDAGRNWKPAGTALKNMTAVAVNPKRPSEVYTVTEQGRLHRSTDGGETWEDVR
jgi:photosystem II stability/assembly factor-like uncharacterized protein